MSTNNQAGKEQRTLLIMRKLLATIVRESTPQPGMKHVLSQKTREDIRMCFGLISAREIELAEEAGIEIKERPRYTDEPKQSTVVSFTPSNKSNHTPDSDSED